MYLTPKSYLFGYISNACARQKDTCQAVDGGWFDLGFHSAVAASPLPNLLPILTASSYPQEQEWVR